MDCSLQKKQNLRDFRERTAGFVEKVGGVKGVAGQSDGKNPGVLFHTFFTASRSGASGSYRLPTAYAVNHSVPLITAETAFADKASTVQWVVRSILRCVFISDSSQGQLAGRNLDEFPQALQLGAPLEPAFKIALRISVVSADAAGVE
ncbi:hypothetical protein BC1002_4185 [Paraburkholderia atlantica]|uniref:Uncharacterized protein n=1 Tax=Paraburkholderia atlantica TaxID=2654982 RepID=D5WI85_PARAM|nr:hypothetical protein [Paraburkholderia atlantica]ADG18180.1 hypothetical protein BC1002_4185 [Paraburkholderia atlantica]